ncbi:MAG: 50S ribosomal protein L3 [Verrucomicrobiae bacterium]|nr:50S ribosomal protein L3 [Verrucomicrobiae bacterium]MDW8344573.1 50S ribosomal protein L3 [Verrucomicrobiae bacterium]
MELLGRKLGMTQVFDERGNLCGVTVLEVGPCTVLQKKTRETDGYRAFQLGFGERKTKHVTKPMLGHFKKAGVSPMMWVREYRTDDEQVSLNVGDRLTVKAFQVGQYVDVIGVSKGRGFQGVVKRHHFRGGDAAHGCKGWHRRPGAISTRMTPGWVKKNQRMPGHMGHTRVTVQNLRVLGVREADNVLLIEGAVPGPRGGLVVVRHAKKRPPAGGK